MLWMPMEGGGQNLSAPFCAPATRETMPSCIGMSVDMRGGAPIYPCICIGIPVQMHGPRGLRKENETM
jgi:hypothetical protein